MSWGHGDILWGPTSPVRVVAPDLNAPGQRLGGPQALSRMAISDEVPTHVEPPTADNSFAGLDQQQPPIEAPREERENAA